MLKAIGLATSIMAALLSGARFGFGNVSKKSQSFVISSDTEYISWRGRTYYDPAIEGTWFDYSLSGFDISFQGTELNVKLHSKSIGGDIWNPYISVVVDGDYSNKNVKAISLHAGETESIKVASSLAQGEHTVSIYKRSEPGYTSTAFISAETDGYFVTAPAKALNGRIEVYGDDVTCGSFVENTIAHPTFSTKETNPLKTCNFYAAQNLNLDISCICGSGYPAYYSTSKSSLFKIESVPQMLSMASFDRDTTETSYVPWDNSQYIPDAVIINLGINDSAYYNTLKEDRKIDYLQEFKEAYSSFISSLLSLYPKTKIVCMTGMIATNDNIVQAIKSAINNNPRVTMLESFSRSVGGIMPSNHPNEAMQKYAGEELSETLSELLSIPYENKESAKTAKLTKIISVGSFVVAVALLPAVYVGALFVAKQLRKRREEK